MEHFEAFLLNRPSQAASLLELERPIRYISGEALNAHITLERVYPSASLEGDEIRVLHLLPGALEDELMAYLEIGHRESFAYDALSYTWGRSDEHRSVMVDGQDIPITDNLWYVLRRLRHLDRDRILWVDAICINQKDGYERAHQVARMVNTYRSAESVIIWLGEPHRSSTAAWKSIQIHEPCAMPGEEGRDKETIAMYSALSRALMSTQPFWWSRAWTLQEVMASKHTIVRFGTWELSWRRETFLLELHKWTQQYYVRFDGQPKPLNSAIARLLTQTERAAALRQSATPGHFSFSQLAGIITTREALDPRDYFYSPLGIMQLSVSNLITPDYAWPTWRVFAQATCAVMWGECSLEILLYVDVHDSRAAELPSWSIDLTQVQRHDWKSPLKVDATPSIKPRVRPSRDCKTLFVDGRQLGKVATAFQFSMDCTSPALEERQYVATILHNARNCTWLPHLRGVAHETGASIKPWANTCLDAIGSGICEAFNGWTDLAGLSEGTAAMDWCRSIAHATVDYARDMKQYPEVFTTDAGLMGISYSDISIDDTIILVPGSRLCMVLRPKGEQFTFRGLCYVHGTMDTSTEEVLDFWFETDLLTDQTFSVN